MLFNEKKKKSGRHDLNVRLPAPKAGALAKLSYAPMCSGSFRLLHQSFFRTRAAENWFGEEPVACGGAECSGHGFTFPEFCAPLMGEVSRIEKTFALSWPKLLICWEKLRIVPKCCHTRPLCDGETPRFWRDPDRRSRC